MKINIKEYKGQTIYYNDDNDKFECDISIEDNFKKTKRQSLKDVRKEIDNFIKINLNFVPFDIIEVGYGDEIEVKTISALRSDGKFVVNGKYSNSYVSLSDLKKNNIYDPYIIKKYNEGIEELEKARNVFTKLKEELIKELKPLDLSKYQYIINPEESK